MFPTLLLVLGAGLVAGALLATFAWRLARREPAVVDPASGLGRAAAACDQWPDLATRAREREQAIGIVVLRFPPHRADTGARALAELSALPAHAWRTEYDEVCLATHAHRAAGLVAEADALLVGLADAGTDPDAIGLAAAPFDGEEFAAVLAAARSRLVPPARIREAARSIASSAP